MLALKLDDILESRCGFGVREGHGHTWVLRVIGHGHGYVGVGTYNIVCNNTIYLLGGSFQTQLFWILDF